MANSERVVASVNEVSPVTVMYRREILRLLGFGLAIGVLFAGVYYLLEHFVFGSVLCRPGNDMACASAPSYAMAVSIVLTAVVGLVGLVQLRGYRPLIVVLAIAVSYWGLNIILQNITWYIGLIVAAVLFALSYLLFSWIARLRSLSITLLLTIVVVILIRLALVS